MASGVGRLGLSCLGMVYICCMDCDELQHRKERRESLSRTAAGAQGKAVLSRREPVYRRDVRNQRDGMQVDKTGLFISLVVPLGARQGGGRAGRQREEGQQQREAGEERVERGRMGPQCRKGSASRSGPEARWPGRDTRPGTWPGARLAWSSLRSRRAKAVS